METLDACGFRQSRECACTTVCAVAKPITPAPVVLPSWRTQAITCLFLGVVATFVSAAVMEAKLKRQDLINQESAHVVTR
jgi:membrane protein implicated in regulation of membrane protease activity